MQSTMTHYNPDWNIWDATVATGSTVMSGTSGALDIQYNCNNNLRSNYRVATSGQITIGGNAYSAAAYDTFDDNVLCGT